MNFDEAESKFRELQARVQRGETISRADYEEEVAKLAVLDERGVMWEINPRTGKWMYFDGTEWVVGRPPGRDQSTVMPITQAMQPPPSSVVRKSTVAATSTKPAAATPMARVSAPTVRPVAKPQPTQSARTGSSVLSRTAASPAPPPQLKTSSLAKPTTAPPSAPSAGPESVQSYGRTQAGGGMPAATATGKVSTNVLKQKPLMGGGREWIPLAIGAVVLLVCAIALIFGANAARSIISPSTPTRTPTPRASSTPLPPPTLLPSPTPLPPTPAPVIAKVKENTVNVRAAPDRRARLVGSVKKDAQLTLLARTEDALWVQINIPNVPQPGWISAEFLQITSGDIRTLPVSGAPTPTPTPTRRVATTSVPQLPPTPTVIGAPTSTPTS